MKRHEYKGYIADTDNLGRIYIYDTESPYSEDSDHILVGIDYGKREWSQVKAIIDARVSTGQDVRSARIDPHSGEIKVG